VQGNWSGSLVDGQFGAAGLEYRRNRYYDPQQGRFTQEDPIGLAGGMNLYGFAGGDPVNFADPFGLCKNAKGDPVSPRECDAPTPEVTLDTKIAEAVLWVTDLGVIGKALAGGVRELTVAYLRRRAVSDAWKMEAEMIRRTGQGTRAWTESEIEEIRATGRVGGYQGHHINSVNAHPELAGNPDNVAFRRAGQEHLEEHLGNYRNPTSGPLLNRRP